MKLKLKSIITAAITALGVIMLPFSANAADTVNKTIAVSTAEELSSITGNGTYCIYNDIDLEGFDWKGISDFSGTLYAYSDCVIKNMNSDDCGLFRKLSSGAKIQNIHLENVNIKTKTKMLGGLVSYIPASSKGVEVVDCSVNGSVCTRFQGSSTLNYCGGIAGVVSAKDCVISGCSSSAIVGSPDRQGGIVGLNYGNISDCVFTGCVKNSENFSPEDSEEEWLDLYTVSQATGGITSVNVGSISNCVGLLSDCGSATYLGLVSGVNITGKGKINNCIALKADKWTRDGDSENISEIANNVKSKDLTFKLKS